MDRDSLAYVLHGETYAHKTSIQTLGFRWDHTEKVWVKRANICDMADNLALEKLIRTLRGVSMTREKPEKFQVLQSYGRYRR